MSFNIFNKPIKNKTGKYTIGVSSGLFGMAKPEEKISLIDLSQKGFYSALKGVKFTQIDLETATELDSPDIDNRLERIRGLGISYAFHGETPAMGGAQIALTSAIEDQYRTGHKRFVKNLEGSGRLKAVYYLQHSCEGPPAETPYIRLGESMQPTSVVDIWGRRLYIFLDEKDKEYLQDWAIEQEEITTAFRVGSPKELSKNPKFMKGLEEECKAEVAERWKKEGKEIKSGEDEVRFKEEVKRKVDERALPRAIESVKKDLLESLHLSNMVFGAEKIPYLIIGKWMSDKKDPIWVGIVGNKKFESVKENPPDWVPAVAAKYIWGHLNPLPSMENKFKDPKKILEKYNFDLVIETPMVSKGMEEEYRLVKPKHFAILCKNSGTKHCGVVIDFEHCLGAGINPDKEIEEFCSDGGKYVKALHVGWPTPLQPAHVPLPLGSEQQEWLYRWMLALRKKGFNERENRYIIFERGGGVGGDPVDQSTLALKKIVEFLRQDKNPDELPKEFFGMEDKIIKMQESEIREHAFDPVKGLLAVPEEKHGFLSKAAVGKGKEKEWETEKYR